MKVISIIGEKGGIAKSTATFNLAWALAKEKGKRVLIIDLDPQRANITSFAGLSKVEDKKTMYDVLVKKVNMKKAVLIVKDNLHIVPADSLVREITAENGSLSRFKMALNEIRAYYDYVFIDVPPSPGQSHVLTVGSADYLIIPVESRNIPSLDAGMGMAKTIYTAKESVNPNLQVLGVLLNKYSLRTLLSRQVMKAAEKLASGLDTVVLDTKLRDNVQVAEAVGSHEGITDYAPKSNGAKDILALMNEIEERMNQHESDKPGKTAE